MRRSNASLFFLAVLATLGVAAAARAEHEGKIQILLLGDSTTEASIPRKLAPNEPQLEDVIRDLLACGDVIRAAAGAVGLQHFRGQGVDEDGAVCGTVERYLAHHPFQRGFDQVQADVPVPGGEVEDRQVAAADDLAEDRLAAAAAELGEPTAARLHVAGLDDLGLGEVRLE